MKSKLVAVLLAFFLGGLGAHKFYLGKPLVGLVYLVLCWTYIPTIIALIEGIGYLCTNENDFQARFGNPVERSILEKKFNTFNNNNNPFKKS